MHPEDADRLIELDRIFDNLSARIAADQLGHSNVSMTQDRYMKRGGVHQQVADLMDRTVDMNDE